MGPVSLVRIGKDYVNPEQVVAINHISREDSVLSLKNTHTLTVQMTAEEVFDLLVAAADNPVYITPGYPEEQS